VGGGRLENISAFGEGVYSRGGTLKYIWIISAVKSMQLL